jgi:hypothetical protein
MGQAATAGAPKITGTHRRIAGRTAGIFYGHTDMEPGSQEPMTVRKGKRISPKTPDRKHARTDGRTKATLLLPDSVDFRLTTIAKSLKLDRSVLASQLIDAGLRRYALDAALRLHAGGDTTAEPERAGE